MPTHRPENQRWLQMHHNENNETKCRFSKTSVLKSVSLSFDKRSLEKRETHSFARAQNTPTLKHITELSNCLPPRKNIYSSSELFKTYSTCPINYLLSISDSSIVTTLIFRLLHTVKKAFLLASAIFTKPAFRNAAVRRDSENETETQSERERERDPSCSISSSCSCRWRSPFILSLLLVSSH